MAKPENGENREFIRAFVSLPARVKAVDTDGKDTCRVLGSGGVCLEELLAGEGDAAPDPATMRLLAHIADSLAHLDEKLDRVIGLLGGERPEEHIAVDETLDISGSGMSMVLTGPVEVGRRLAISLAIPGFPLGGFKTQADVVRVRPLTGGKEGLFEVGVAFTGMSEKQREDLISFVFRNLRASIRAEKEGADRD